MAAGVRVAGVDQVRRSLQRFTEQVADLSEVLYGPVQDLADDAAARATKLTGRMALGITATTVPGGVRLEATEVYSGVINYGWPARNIAAQPFMPEMDTVEATAAERGDDGLQDIADQLGLS